MSRVAQRIRARIGARVTIGIGISRSEIRLMAVGRGGAAVWQSSSARDRDRSLTTQITAMLGKRPATVRGRISVASVVGPNEAQLRPLHGLPQLRSAVEQNTLVTENVDRFFVSDGARMRISLPAKLGDGELWAAAVQQDIVTGVAASCRASGLRFAGAAPIAAALGTLLQLHPDGAPEVAERIRLVSWTDEGTRLNVEHRGTQPARIWREHVSITAPRGLAGVTTPPSVEPAFGDAYAASLLRARDPFVVTEHTDHQRRARHAAQRTVLWSVLAAAGLVACAWLPGTLANRRAERARTRLAALHTRADELSRAQASLTNATTALNGIAAFERSRRSATVLLAELALALPDSTALTALRVDSAGGTLTVLAPRAAPALQAVTEVPSLARVQLAGAVTREVTGGVQLERASLRFGFVGKERKPAALVLRTAMTGRVP